MAYDPQLQTLILRTFVRTLDGWQRRRARQHGDGNPRWGGVTVIQRFGSALQLTPHYHTLGMDGVYDIDADGARFHRLEPPTDHDVEGLVERVGARVLATLERRGVLPPDDPTFSEPDALGLDELVMAACYGAAIQGRLAFGEGSGQRPPRLGVISDPPFVESCAALSGRSRGLDLHAGVAVAAGNRLALERLCRYIARPPLAHDRLERLEDGRLALRLKRPFSDGSSHIVYTPKALIERLCALVPRPRTHRVRLCVTLSPPRGPPAGRPVLGSRPGHPTVAAG